MGLAMGLNPIPLYFLTITLNSLLYFPIIFLLRKVYRRGKVKLFDRYIDNLRRRGKPVIDKLGTPGLIIFVGIPLPFTGVYTVTILSWLLDIQLRRAFPAIIIGVCIAGLIVTLVSLGMFR